MSAPPSGPSADLPPSSGPSDEAAWHTVMAPRAYQREALAAAMSRNILLALDANAGKTLVAAELIARMVRGRLPAHSLPTARSPCRRPRRAVHS